MLKTLMQRPLVMDKIVTKDQIMGDVYACAACFFFSPHIMHAHILFIL
jgi:hypothetical protein